MKTCKILTMAFWSAAITALTLAFWSAAITAVMVLVSAVADSAMAVAPIAAPVLNAPQTGLPVVFGIDADQDGAVDEEAPAILRSYDPGTSRWSLVVFPVAGGTVEASAHGSPGSAPDCFWMLR